jgi:hypothetical protein
VFEGKWTPRASRLKSHCLRTVPPKVARPSRRIFLRAPPRSPFCNFSSAIGAIVPPVAVLDRTFAMPLRRSIDANTAGVLTMDEASRLASNFAKLPELLGRARASASVSALLHDRTQLARLLVRRQPRLSQEYHCRLDFRPIAGTATPHLTAT